MEALWAILLCILSVFGLYALFTRIAILLSPRGRLSIAIDGKGKSVEEILADLRRARLLLERDASLSSRVVLLLSEEDAALANALRAEGLTVCILKSIE